MAQMLDLIKRNAVPAAVMRSAARGALPVSADETIQILVYLTGNPLFAEEARMTLAGWDQNSAIQVLSGGNAPQEVLEYFWSKANRRPGLMPALIETPLIPEQQVAELAAGASHELVAVLLASPRAQGSPAILEALAKNPQLTPAEQLETVRKGIVAAEAEGPDPESEAAHQNWQQEHAQEIAAEEGKAFELVGEDQEPAPALPLEPPPAPPSPSVPVAQPAALPQKAAATVDARKLTTLQRVGRMNVAQRVKTAFLGNKEERSLLIRDGSRIVQSAVMSSPKLTESEVESFSAARNVHENVLREISRNRRFMKNYSIVRNLVNNPRSPLDLALPLVKNLLVTDLKILQSNKNVSDTVRKVAYKLYKEKSTPVGQKTNY